MPEIEAKFLTEAPAQVSRLLAGLEAYHLELRPLPALEVVDRYLDTPNWSIFRAGWAYRWREQSGTRTIGLKSLGMDGGAVQTREEIEQDVDKFPTNGRRWSGLTVPRSLKSIKCKHVHELFAVRNHRRRYELRSGNGTVIELVIDHARIVRGDFKSHDRASDCLEFDELELELKAGPETALRELADRLQQQFNLLPARMSKFERGLYSSGQIPPRASQQPLRKLNPNKTIQQLKDRRPTAKDPLTHLACRSLLIAFEQMLVQEPHAWEGLDKGGVHQMRVAIRRIRAALRAFKRVLPDTDRRTFNREFKWLARELGSVRDLDVNLVNFADYASSVRADDLVALEAYQTHLETLHRRARGNLVTCLSSSRYRHLVNSFINFLTRVQAPPVHIGRSVTVAASARRLLGRHYKTVIRDGRNIHSETPELALHQLRIECKRLRYLFEFFRPAYGKDFTPHVKRLKQLQDVLGELHDANVAEHQLRTYAEHVPMEPEHRNQLIVLGQLIHSQRAVASARRAAFHKVWRQFDIVAGRKQLINTIDGKTRDKTD